ncbi:hypothetical protein LJ656_25710 [Paraburkholderia sp. MMS20-SJTR3]|uniref:N,N-dimethylformamidase beta subunit-like C-terminal domain-containing protein n=1 Tax=Paraburkholderia sejongensis TaxID=2886946 RepID=A0ABS8K1H5_9BURK|nr:N,N-dimethylformamidase beta subunit family domain-containing protein [Paraburkholderia sp. MMS20-SJTR3]MCC8395987.1 hypothetical protein [Paraburkholderia sp. MMS20-SJTR3]
MRLYPLAPAYDAGGVFELAVEPGRRFSIAIYRQGIEEPLVYDCGIRVEEHGAIACDQANGKWILTSPRGRVAPDRDGVWGWPSFRFRFDRDDASTGVYAAVAYEVRANGEPVDPLGRRCAKREPIYGLPPDSKSMAMLVARPTRPSAPIAYIVPVATYHAYNSIGPGGFYHDPVRRKKRITTVTLLRPGGGFGGQFGEPADPYDPHSPRQQFPHWDAKFVRWLQTKNIACDFYTDLDLDDGERLDLSQYRCLLSVGHHEYWSRSMRERTAAFIANGGHHAIFSGNTCFRPVEFARGDSASPDLRMIRLAENWPGYDESDLIGLSYGYGGGWWGEWHLLRGGWIKKERPAVGFRIEDAGHWALAGTRLNNGDILGAEDRLVGYEVDGLPPTPNGFHVLGRTAVLDGWDVGGRGVFGVLERTVESGVQPGIVFNAATTDWARVLMDPRAESMAVVDRITSNVFERFVGNSNNHGRASVVEQV